MPLSKKNKVKEVQTRRPISTASLMNQLETRSDRNSIKRHELYQEYMANFKPLNDQLDAMRDEYLSNPMVAESLRLSDVKRLIEKIEYMNKEYGGFITIQLDDTTESIHISIKL